MDGGGTGSRRRRFPSHNAITWSNSRCALSNRQISERVVPGNRASGREVGFSSIGLADRQDAPVVVLGMGYYAGASQREVRSSNLSPGQVSTSSRSSLLGLKKGIFFGGTSTRAPVFGFRPMRARLWRVWNRPNPRISTLSPDRSARTTLSNMAQTTTSDSFRDSSVA